MILLLAMGLGCGSDSSATDPDIVQLFRRLDANGSLSEAEIGSVERFMDSYHRQTTLHCDEVWRRPSPDGRSFKGRGEKVLSSASVADVSISAEGVHTLVYNDTRPGRLVELLREDPARLWAQGLLGFGGIGLAQIVHGETRELSMDLHLEHVQEAVDPDLGVREDGHWRLTWFGVEPDQMNPDQHGPLASHKPHHFYRSESATLGDFPRPTVAVASREGTTGGADPTVLELEGGAELLLVGPLDHTAMAWRSEDGQSWNAEAPPTLDTGVKAATPDALRDPAGGYRLYYMVNGEPGRFGLSTSTDGLQWGPETVVMEDGDAFNISVDVDPSGTWWAYYNRTNSDCLAQWGSTRIIPGSG